MYTLLLVAVVFAILWVVELVRNGSLKVAIVESVEYGMEVFEEGCQIYRNLEGQEAINAELVRQLEHQTKVTAIWKNTSRININHYNRVFNEKSALYDLLMEQKEISANWKRDSRNGWAAYEEALGEINELQEENRTLGEVKMWIMNS